MLRRLPCQLQTHYPRLQARGQESPADLPAQRSDTPHSHIIILLFTRRGLCSSVEQREIVFRRDVDRTGYHTSHTILLPHVFVR